MPTIIIPSFDFSATYYQQILEALLEFKRVNVPELSDESPQEPLIQLLRAFALVGHLNNTLLDLVANESTLPTSRLPETIRNMLRLIDFELRPASPSLADIVFKLSSVLTATTEVIPAVAKIATEVTPDEAAIPFEVLAAIGSGPTNVLDLFIATESDTDTDFTSEANTPFSGFNPWATPDAGDSIIFGHFDVMWDEIDVVIITPGSDFTGVWEYFDDDVEDGKPDNVTDQGTTLRLELNGILGAADRSGAKIVARLDSTRIIEENDSQFDGVNFVEVSLLGQTIPSTDVEDYTVGSDFKELPNVVDGTSDFSATGKVTFTLPQSLADNWKKIDPPSVSPLFVVRYRIISVSSPTTPMIDTVKIDTGSQFILGVGVQGNTIVETLGSSDGSVDQEFEAARDFFIDNSEVVKVGVDTWTSVISFLNSKATDQHYVVRLGENDRATIAFGDGVTGAIPAVGVNNVTIVYRQGANNDGNVGTGKVIVDKSGLSFVNDVTNPRPATGWRASDASNDESLEAAKIEGPATLRARSVAVGPDDVETIALEFTPGDGTRPIARSRAFEEGFGPKTVELIVMSTSGDALAQSVLDDLDEFFNGDRFAEPPVPKKIVANQEVTSVNFAEKTVNVTATVTGGNAATITERLTNLIQPEARDSQGLFEWEFGEDVSVARLIHEIFQIDSDVINVVVTSPASDVPLTKRELPKAGTISITAV